MNTDPNCFYSFLTRISTNERNPSFYALPYLTSFVAHSSYSLCYYMVVLLYEWCVMLSITV